MKEPMHPGKILKDIMIDNGWCTYSPKEVCSDYIQNCLNLYSLEFTEKLLRGDEDIDYLVAYKLGSNIGGTDMALWLKLQKDYDDYVESSMEKDMQESIGQFNEDIENERYDEVIDLVSLRNAELYLAQLNLKMREVRREDRLKSGLCFYGITHEDVMELSEELKHNILKIDVIIGLCSKLNEEDVLKIVNIIQERMLKN